MGWCVTFGGGGGGGKGDLDEKFVAVLEIPPVNSPQTAVKVAIVAEIKKSKGKQRNETEAS